MKNKGKKLSFIITFYIIMVIVVVALFYTNAINPLTDGVLKTIDRVIYAN